MAIRVLLVDDHQIILQALQALLEALDDITVVGTAVDGRQAIELASELRPDVVVMDLDMPRLNGLESTRAILFELPRSGVLILSGQADERTLGRALKAGAKGFIVKTAVADDLLAGIRAVAAGDVFMSEGVAKLLVNGLRRGGEDHLNPLEILSTREREVLQLIAEGSTTKGIAGSLAISTKTAETHRRNLMDKLGIDSVADLTKLAIREGMTKL